ncbi:MAG: ribbon-helix-helix domain-containing protein [Acidobacteriota bacterium]|nr:ribbon-helix-helix domain-containing protein [Acidobacteriota bacterium]
MPKAKIAVSIDGELLRRLDRLVESGTFPNRSRAVESALTEKLDRLNKIRLARECARLDPGAEKELAEEGFSEDVARWPEY